MALVITNGTYYLKTNRNGGIEVTSVIGEAQQFYNVNIATRKMMKAPGRAKGYYVFDTEGDEHPSVGKKKNRKKYSEDVRRMIYNRAGGRCQLCGRKITYEELTLDHIVPLAMGGKDCVSNLQVADAACNGFKGSILPEKFMDRITEIFMFQMENRHSDNVNWKMARNLLMEIL